MTISSTLLALVLMPLCVWIYSRAWINTPLVQLLPLGAITLTLCSTLIPIGLGVFIRYKYNRVADYIVKVTVALPFPCVTDAGSPCALSLGWNARKFWEKG